MRLPHPLMLTRLRQFGDWLLFPAVVLTAIQPLLRGALPWSADGLLHFYRLAQLDRALRHGMLFPRWAPDMGFGYGFPLFNYYAPLSYYLAEPFHLAGLSVQSALLAAFALGIFVACAGAYLWARDLFGRPAGLVAAVAFVHAPYTLYNTIHRGALAEVWGLAWLPFVFWALRRLSKRGHRNDLALASTFYAALLLTHNVLALISTPMLIVYAGILWRLHGGGLRRALLLGGTLLLGLGLATFFWAPAFLERGYVQIHQLYLPGDLDYHNNFTSLGQLFAASQPVDPALINPFIPLSFGWPQLALALVALLGLAFSTRRNGRPDSSGALPATCPESVSEESVKHPEPDFGELSRAAEGCGSANEASPPAREARLHVVLLSLSLPVLVAMMLPCSVAVWDHLPLLRFVQFPWRFLGPASLFLALLAAAGWNKLSSQPAISRFGLPIVLVVTIVFAFTWLFPHYYPPQPQPTPLNLIAFERETGALGTTSAGDYLPVWVQRLPPAESLVPAYEQAGPDPVIPRLDSASLPSGAQVVETRYGLTRADLTIETPTAFTATLNWYFFPGWQARLDDQPLELRPVGEHGLIGAAVPAGRHHLTVRFGDTPLRRAANIVSGIGLVVLLAILLIPIANCRSQIAYPRSPSSILHSPLLILTALALFTLKAGYLDQHDSIFRHSRFDGQSVSGVQSPLHVNFDDQMLLLGYDLTPPSPPLSAGEQGGVTADGVLDVALYWRALRPLDTDYSIAVHLVDDQGRLYGQRDSQHPAGYPTSRWQTDAYARDLHRLAVWPGTPPGGYTLEVSVYNGATGRRLDVRDAAGIPVGTTYRLASVQVTRPTRPPDPASLNVARRLQTDLGGGLLLLGFDPPPTEVNAGDRLPLTLYWQAASAPTADYTAHLSLAADSGETVAEERVVPGRAGFPTSAWKPRDVVRDVQSVLIPAATPAGEYVLRLGLLDAAGIRLGLLADLLTVTVHAPERSFALPPVQVPFSITLDSRSTGSRQAQATLLGTDLSGATLAAGQSFTLTLYWQAEATAETGYIVFVHLLDQAEHIYAQSDRPPADGARPTTGWLPGEIIQDTHTLTVAPDAPPGRYVLEVGMYDPTSGDRLRASDPTGADIGDRILLPTTIQVKQ